MSKELETSVIGQALSEPHLFTTAMGENVTAASFSFEPGRAIFAAAQKMIAQGETPEPCLLGEALPEHRSWLFEAMAAAPTTAYFMDHIALLRKHESVRSIKAGLSTLQEQAADDDAEPNSLLDGLAELETRVALSTARQGEMTTSELVEEWRAKRTVALPPPVQIFTPGSEAARRVMLRHGQIFTIAGQTGLGKTALAAGMAVSALRAGLSVAYFCAESSAEEIVTRIAAAACGIPHYAPDYPNCRHEIRDRFDAAMGEVAAFGEALGVLGNEGAGITPGRVDAAIRRRKLKSGRCDLIILDFIQILSPPPGSERRSNLEKLNDTLDALHGVITRHSVAAIVLSQCNRAGLRSGEEPSLEWLKDSSKLGELSHVVAFLVRGDDGDRLMSRKTRGMPPFDLKLKWNGATYTSQPEFPMP